MSDRYANESDVFASISTSPEVLATLRRRMTAIEHAADTQQVYLASERAQGFVEALEVLKVFKPGEIELVLARGRRRSGTLRRCCYRRGDSRRRAAQPSSAA